jgi:hypothetical protein
VVAVASLTAGFWFGGDTVRGVSVWAVVVLAVVVLLGDLLGSPERWQPRLASAAVMAAVFAAGWYLGVVELDRAFEGCVERGEEVRLTLEEHHRVNGRFPESLDELDRVEIPGGRLLRTGLMRYARTSEGYELRFADATARMTASHERGFFDR